MDVKGCNSRGRVAYHLFERDPHINDKNLYQDK